MKIVVFVMVVLLLAAPSSAYLCTQVDGDNTLEAVSDNCGGFSPCSGGMTAIYVNGAYVGTLDAGSNIMGPCVITKDLVICDLGDDEIVMGCRD
jgi:hypothetical protein